MTQNTNQDFTSQQRIAEVMQIEGISFDQMRIEFLRLSPAYALMAKICKLPIQAQNEQIIDLYANNASALARRKFLKTTTSKFTKDQEERILAGFEFVRSTYNEYGNLNQSYKVWTRDSENSIFLINSYLNYPSTHLIAIEREHGQPLSRFVDDMTGYLKSSQGTNYIHEPRIVVSIPVNASLKIVMQDIKNGCVNFHYQMLIDRLLVQSLWLEKEFATKQRSRNYTY